MPRSKKDPTPVDIDSGYKVAFERLQVLLDVSRTREKQLEEALEKQSRPVYATINLLKVIDKSILNVLQASDEARAHIIPKAKVGLTNIDDVSIDELKGAIKEYDKRFSIAESVSHNKKPIRLIGGGYRRLKTKLAVVAKSVVRKYRQRKTS